MPGGSTGVIAFILATDPTNGRSTGNTIDDNALRASCTGGCLGIGYFATRGTGYDAAGDWKPSFFTGTWTGWPA